VSNEILPNQSPSSNGNPPWQRRAPTHRPYITDSEKNWLFSALIQLPSVFERAKLSLKEEHFAPHEKWLKLVWALTVN
jgi:hypothetical protein